MEERKKCWLTSAVSCPPETFCRSPAASGSKVQISQHRQQTLKPNGVRVLGESVPRYLPECHLHSTFSSPGTGDLELGCCQGCAEGEECSLSCIYIFLDKP